MTDGLTVLGRVFGDNDGPFRAELGDGRQLGAFDELKQARRAIRAAMGGEPA